MPKVIEFNAQNKNAAKYYKEIVEALKEQLNITIDKKKVSASAKLKEIGVHNVELKLHSEVKVVLKVRVEAK